MVSRLILIDGCNSWFSLGSIERCLDRARMYYLNIHFGRDDRKIRHFYLEILMPFGENGTADALHSPAKQRLRRRPNLVSSRLSGNESVEFVMSEILFSRNPGSSSSFRYLRSVYPWALFESRAALFAFNDGVFSSFEEEDRSAWSNLGLLAVSHLPRSKGKGRARLMPSTGLDGGVESQSGVLGWTIICMLAAISLELSWLRQSHSQLSAVCGGHL